MRDRGTYRGRIVDGTDREKWGSGRVFLKEVYGVKIENLRTRFSQIPAGKISGNFSEKFFGNYFWRGKYCVKKIL
jgi:hypothetical protein